MEITDLRGSLPTNGAYLTRRNPPTTIVVHHSATAPTVSTRAIAEYHIGPEKGYPGIAYAYVIDADGFVAQTNDDMAVTWHAGCAAIHGPNCPDNANTYSIGVCLKGDFTDAPPPKAQLAAARALITVLRERYGSMTLIGHKEAHGVSTSCPGATWPQWRGQLEDTMTNEARAAAIKARFEWEEIVRLMEDAKALRVQAAESIATAERKEAQAFLRLQQGVNTRDGVAYKPEVLLGGNAPAGWEG